MYNALSSLYTSPLSRIVLNDEQTDWFECPLGVRQGDTISPTEYKYLGVTINQFLNFEKMSNALYDSAKRALNTIICEMIKHKGFPYKVYEMFYNACVCSIMDYGH